MDPSGRTVICRAEQSPLGKIFRLQFFKNERNPMTILSDVERRLKDIKEKKKKLVIVQSNCMISTPKMSKLRDFN